MEADLAVLVEQAVARQIRPLREELAGAQGQASLRDVLGGVGYILGLAGLLAWWRSRRASGAE
jgi:nickel transport protein